jgi:hypothetical protein
MVLKTMLHNKVAINTELARPALSLEAKLRHIDVANIQYFHAVVEWPSARFHVLPPVICTPGWPYYLVLQAYCPWHLK